MAKKEQDKKKGDDAPIDLAARIGGRSYEPAPPPPPVPPAATAPLPPRLDGPLPPRRDARPVMIGMDEPSPPPTPTIASEPSADEQAATGGAIPSPRTPPGPNEIDLVITPLPTPEDWHRFEKALRRVPGVLHGESLVRTEYYRHGVLKVRVTYEGQRGLANALRAGVPGFRVRVIGEDRTTIQLLIAGESEERTPS